MSATETRPQTGAQTYTQRLIELFSADHNTARADAYLGQIADLAAGQGIEFVLQQVLVGQNQDVKKAAKDALIRIKTDTLLIPVARKTVPKVIEQHGIQVSRVSRIPLPERAHFIADLIPAGIEVYQRLDRAEHRTDSGPKNESLKYLAGLTVRRAVIAATELPTDQALTYYATAKAYDGSILGRRDFDLVQEFLVAGGDQAVAAISQLMSDQLRRGDAVKMLLAINSEAARDEVARNLAKIEADQVDVNQLAQSGDLRFRARIVELLAGPKTPEDRWRHSQPSKDVGVALDFVTATTDNAQKQKDLMRVLSNQATSSHQPTAEAAIKQLIDSGDPKAFDQAFAGMSRTGHGLSQFMELAKLGQVEVVDRLLESIVKSDIVLTPAQRAMVESLKGLSVSHSELLTEAVGRFLTRALSDSDLRYNRYKVTLFAVEQGLSGLIPTLKELLPKDPDNSTAFSLAKLADEETVGYLLDRLASEQDPKTKSFVASAMEAIPFDKLDQIAPTQAKRLERLSAGAVLTQRQRVIAGLIAAAVQDPAKEVRRSALHSLGQIGDKEVAEVLLIKLSDRDPDVAYAAVSASQEIKKRYAKQAKPDSGEEDEDDEEDDDDD